MSLLLHHSSLSPLISRPPRSPCECFQTWPDSSLHPSGRHQHGMCFAWGRGDWLNTTRLQNRLCSANLSKTPAWNHSFGKSAVHVEQPSRPQKNHFGKVERRWPVRHGRVPNTSAGCSKSPSSKAAADESTGGVASGAHGATNKEHQVCARRRVVRRPGPR
jgi:hypothetical protein